LNSEQYDVTLWNVSKILLSLCECSANPIAARNVYAALWRQNDNTINPSCWHCHLISLTLKCNTKMYISDFEGSKKLLVSIKVLFEENAFWAIQISREVHTIGRAFFEKTNYLNPVPYVFISHVFQYYQNLKEKAKTIRSKQTYAAHSITRTGTHCTVTIVVWLTPK